MTYTVASKYFTNYPELFPFFSGHELLGSYPAYRKSSAKARSITNDPISNFGYDATIKYSVLMCGTCDYSAAYHKNHEQYEVTPFCDRGKYEPFELQYEFDYYLHSNNSVTLIEDYSGQGTKDSTSLPRDNELEFENYHEVIEHIENSWRDQDPEVSTHAIDWWYVTPSAINNGAYATPKNYNPLATQPTEPKSRNAYIEGESAITIEAYDPVVTAKYHRTIMNHYFDKRGNERLGGLLLKKNADTTITVSCVLDSCTASSMTTNPNWSREEMEDFIIAMIRHSNNHCAHWLRSRPTFYKVHAQNCADPSKCNEHYGDLHYCPVTKELKTSENEETILDFLYDHKRYCSDSNCKHDDLIDRELEKALTHA